MGSSAQQGSNSPSNQFATQASQLQGPMAAYMAPMGALMGIAGGASPQTLNQNAQTAVQNSGLIPGQSSQSNSDQSAGQSVLGSTLGTNGNTVVNSPPPTTQAGGMLGSTTPQPSNMLGTVPPQWTNPLTASPPVMTTPTLGTAGNTTQLGSTTGQTAAPTQFTPFFFGRNPFNPSQSTGLGANMQQGNSSITPQWNWY